MIKLSHKGVEFARRRNRPPFPYPVNASATPPLPPEFYSARYKAIQITIKATYTACPPHQHTSLTIPGTIKHFSPNTPLSEQKHIPFPAQIPTATETGGQSPLSTANPPLPPQKTKQRKRKTLKTKRHRRYTCSSGGYRSSEFISRKKRAENIFYIVFLAPGHMNRTDVSVASNYLDLVWGLEWQEGLLPFLTFVEPHTRFGDKLLGIRVHLSPKRECGRL